VLKQSFNFNAVVAAYLAAGVALALLAHFLASRPEYAWLYRH
jgi:hypothetical protein